MEYLKKIHDFNDLSGKKVRKNSVIFYDGETTTFSGYCIDSFKDIK